MAAPPKQPENTAWILPHLDKSIMSGCQGHENGQGCCKVDVSSGHQTVNLLISWEGMCALCGRPGRLRMFADQSHSISEIWAAPGISPATVYRSMKETEPPA